MVARLIARMVACIPACLKKSARVGVAIVGVAIVGVAIVGVAIVGVAIVGVAGDLIRAFSFCNDCESVHFVNAFQTNITTGRVNRDDGFPGNSAHVTR